MFYSPLFISFDWMEQTSFANWSNSFYVFGCSDIIIVTGVCGGATTPRPSTAQMTHQDKPCTLWQNLPLYCYLHYKCSSLELGWPGTPWSHLGCLLPELSTRMTQHQLWPETKVLNKVNHLEFLQIAISKWDLWAL